MTDHGDQPGPANESRPQAGWYPDAEVALQMRWWDGQAWTEDTYLRTEPMPLAAMAQTASGPADQVRSWPAAPMGRRLLARFLDWILSVVIACGAGFGQWPAISAGLRRLWAQAEEAAASGQQFEPLTIDQRLSTALSAIVLIWIFVTLIIDLLFLRLLGATPGKLLLGLRVASTGGERLLLAQIVRRWLSFQVVSQIGYYGAIYAVIDALWVLRHESRQCLHDKFARTVVTSSGGTGSPKATAVRDLPG